MTQPAATAAATARTTRPDDDARDDRRAPGTPRAGARADPAPGAPAGRPGVRRRPCRAARPASLLRHRRAPFVLLVVALLVGTTLGLLVLNTAIAVDSLKATQLRADNADAGRRQVQRARAAGGRRRQHAGAEIARRGGPAGRASVPAGGRPRGTCDPRPDGSVGPCRGSPPRARAGTPPAPRPDGAGTERGAGTTGAAPGRLHVPPARPAAGAAARACRSTSAACATAGAWSS